MIRACARLHYDTQTRAGGLRRSVRRPRYCTLPDCYAAGDAFVFASRTETQGLVLLEAMAQATPVVSIAELGTHSILTDGSGAYVVPEEEPAFAAAVAEALDLPAGAERRRQSRSHAESWASLAMARRMVSFYERVVRESSGIRTGSPGDPDSGEAELLKRA